MTDRKHYPTDLNHKEWVLLEPLLPVQKTGRPRKDSQREMLNAIFYITRTGSSWRMMPHDLPPWQAVYAYFRKLIDNGTWQQINDDLRSRLRIKMERDPHPSTLIIDSQSTKTTEKGNLVATTEASA